MQSIATLHPGHTIILHTFMKLLSKWLCDRGKTTVRSRQNHCAIAAKNYPQK
jgi:hypothetical protein